MGFAQYLRTGAFAALLLMCRAEVAIATPWAEVGDNQLRADITLLEAAGVIDDVTGQWPVPWNQILPALRSNTLNGQLSTVREAADRILNRAATDQEAGFSSALTVDAAATPSVVYDFDGMGRGVAQSQLSLSYNGTATEGSLSLGTFSANGTGRSFKFMPDGTFLAQQIGDEATAYAGWLTHWWGPGWISALALSNNARPMPQIGLQRMSSTASSWPVLNWLGPWQAEFFVGVLDGPRIDPNTGYDAIHFSFNPLPGLEIGLAHTEEICGDHHPCVPLRETFDFQNSPSHTDQTNDEGEMDFRYSHGVFGVQSQVYMSLMNEDSSPFTHSGTTHLFGITSFLPMEGGTPLRLTIEYTDSVPTADIFSFGNVFHGFAYNNYSYVDGMRYRGRTLGFGLDSDSRLLSLQGSWTDSAGHFYELSFHHAQVSNPNNMSGNVVTTAPVLTNVGEARVTLPWKSVKIDLAGRLQDDQPRPDKGFLGSIETALRVPF